MQSIPASGKALVSQGPVARLSAFESERLSAFESELKRVGSNLVYAKHELAARIRRRLRGDFIKVAGVKAIREILSSSIVDATSVMQISTQPLIAGKIRQVTLDGVAQYHAKARNPGYCGRGVAKRSFVAILGGIASDWPGQLNPTEALRYE